MATDSYSSDEMNSDDDMDFWKRRNLEFRILILGRANAGKTTILERLTGSSINDAQVRRDGEILTDQAIEGQNDRGLHNVEDEIRFESKPGFVFHDSRGFEAGSTEELSQARDFVERRSNTVTNLREQLHAIWMCLPLDESRELFDTEKDAFHWAKGTTPLIVIFTKRDGGIANAAQRLKEIWVRPQGIKIRAFDKMVRVDAGKEVDNRVEERKREMREWHGANSGLEFEIVGGMENATPASTLACEALIKTTQNALTGPRMKSLLSVVWGQNIMEMAYWCLYWMFRQDKSQVVQRSKQDTSCVIRWVLCYMLPPNRYNNHHDDNHHYYDNNHDDNHHHHVHEFQAQLGPLFHHYSPALKISEVISVAVLMILLIVNVRDQVLASIHESWTENIQQCIQENNDHIQIKKRKYIHKWKFSDEDAKIFVRKLICCIEKNPI